MLAIGAFAANFVFLVMLLAWPPWGRLSRIVVTGLAGALVIACVLSWRPRRR
jgi:hypothetical protein